MLANTPCNAVKYLTLLLGFCREFFPEDATADVAIILGYALRR